MPINDLASPKVIAPVDRMALGVDHARASNLGLPLAVQPSSNAENSHRLWGYNCFEASAE